MREQRGNNKPSFAGKIFIVVGTLLLMGIVYVSAIMLQSADADDTAFVVKEEPEEVTRIQPASSSDAAAIARLFGAPLPYLPGYAMNGQVLNADYERSPARIVSMQYGGVTVSSVRPAAAAPLLLRNEMSVSSRSDLVCLNAPAMLAKKGEAKCVYFSGSEAAYSIYAPKAGTEEFEALLGQLQWME